MTPTECLDAIGRGESYTNEFKAELNDSKLAETVVCLANGDGGRLFIGVDDDGSVVGARPRHGARTEPVRLVALVANLTAPSVAVTAEIVEAEGGEVIVIQVPRANGLVATTSGLYLRRAINVHGRPECLPMRPHEALARATDVGVVDMSVIPAPDLTVDHLDAVELRRMRDLAQADGDAVLGDLSDLDLLSALGFRTPDGGLTFGAALLFGTPAVLDGFVPTHETAFQVLDGLDVRVNRIERRPLVRSMVDLIDAIRPYSPEDEVSDGIFRLGLPAYAEVAVRELVANALVHRNYALNGQVRVLIEDDTLSITNPGSLPDGITVGTLLSAPPRPRNPRIAEAFKRAGLVERSGRGVNRVFHAQLASGRPEPDYARSTQAWVEARLRTGPADRELARFVAHAHRDGRRVALSTLQVLREVRAERRITSARASEVLQLSAEETRSVLNDLVEQGLIEARGERKGRTYHLAAAMYRHIGDSVGYVRTRGFDDIQQEQMVVTYTTEHGSITRAQAAELCQLTPDQASRLLRRMADQGSLRMVGSRGQARYELTVTRHDR